MQNWMEIVGFALTLVAFLALFSPFKRHIQNFNDWLIAKDKERTRRRLEYVQRQLQDILHGTSHLHFQRSISGGLLAMAVGFTLVFLTFFVRKGDTGSAVVLVLMAFGAAIWQFGSAFRRLNGIREEELRERIKKLEKQMERLKA